MPSGKLIMMNKRKRDDTADGPGDKDNEDAGRAKRQRIRKRSHSDPLRNESVPAEKREALRRLFGRISSVNLEGNQQPVPDPEELYEDLLTEEDEEALVDEVPADMDPEQLGFLVCAQETLRFLNGLGISYQHPVFNHLRLRLLQGISEIGVA